ALPDGRIARLGATRDLHHGLLPNHAAHTEGVSMAHAVPPLPYDYNALEPHVDEQTMRIHHDKHHAAYVNNLNTALDPHADLQKKTVEELIANLDALPEAIRTPVRNNG